MKSRMSCYDTILFTLLCFNYATRKSLMLLNFSDITIYYAIQRGLSEKTISTSSIRYRKDKGERKHKLTYLTITRAGIHYLATQCARHVEWLKYLPNDLAKVRIRGVRCAMAQVERFTRMSIAAQAANAIGASVKPMYLTVDKDALTEHDALARAESVTGAMNSDDADTWWMDESFMDDSIDDFFLDEDGEPDEQSEVLVEDDTADEIDDREPQMLLSTIVYNAMREAEAKNRYPNEKTDIVFHSSREIKSILNSNIKSASSTLASRDLMICRYSGLLESCSNSLLLYVPNAMGMDWRERIVRKELATHTAFAKLFSKFGPIRYDQQHGAVLVQNEKMLGDIFFDKQNRRGENEVLGRSFNKFYIIPLDKGGMDDLRTIMTKDLEKIRQQLLEAAIRSGVYQRNDKLSTELFPLQNQEGTLIADGTIMDLVQINAIETLASHIPDLQYGVLCRKRQLPYYQRIMPRACFMLVE